MIIEIRGKRGEGKSLMAKSISKDPKYDFSTLIHENDLSGKFWTDSWVRISGLIIVDGVKNYRNTFDIFNRDKLVIRRRGEMPYEIDMPDVVLIHESE